MLTAIGKWVIPKCWAMGDTSKMDWVVRMLAYVLCLEISFPVGHTSRTVVRKLFSPGDVFHSGQYKGHIPMADMTRGKNGQINKREFYFSIQTTNRHDQCPRTHTRPAMQKYSRKVWRGAMRAVAWWELQGPYRGSWRATLRGLGLRRGSVKWEMLACPDFGVGLNCLIIMTAGCLNSHRSSTRKLWELH